MLILKDILKCINNILCSTPCCVTHLFRLSGLRTEAVLLEFGSDGHWSLWNNNRNNQKSERVAANCASRNSTSLDPFIRACILNASLGSLYGKYNGCWNSTITNTPKRNFALYELFSPIHQSRCSTISLVNIGNNTTDSISFGLCMRKTSISNLGPGKWSRDCRVTW